MVEISGTIEIDEMFIRGKKGFNNGNNSQTLIVFGMLCRESKKMVMIHVPNKSSNTLHPILANNIAQGSTIISDKMSSYVTRNNRSLLNQYGYQHLWTNHSLYYVDPTDNRIHTNTIERLWRKFRLSISHIRRSVSSENIQSEIDYFNFKEQLPTNFLLEVFLYISKIK
jgi:hypothetical protein